MIRFIGKRSVVITPLQNYANEGALQSARTKPEGKEYIPLQFHMPSPRRQATAGNNQALDERFPGTA